MIERYSLACTAAQVADHFGVDPYGFEKQRYNAAPSQLLPVITSGSTGLSHFYWGTMPQWAKNKAISEKIINVHCEQISERATLRKSLKKYRCLVPADGFYLWKRLGKKTSIPYRLRPPDKGLFGMAGFWEEFDDETGEVFHTFTLVTCASSSDVAALGERMPAILKKEDYATWLQPEVEEAALLALLEKTSKGIPLENYTVSPRIHDAGNDEASLLLPAPPADQHGNLTLFS